MLLSSIKKSWRIEEFIAREAQYEFQFGKAPPTVSKLLKMENSASNIFQQFARVSQFKTPRIGFLFGRVIYPNEASKVSKVKTKTKVKKNMSLKGIVYLLTY